jgi:hypothetical protein
MLVFLNGDAVFIPLLQPPTWRTWLPLLGNLLKYCLTWLAVQQLGCHWLAFDKMCDLNKWNLSLTHI